MPLSVERDAADRRKARLAWAPAAGASEYVVRYGIDPARLNHHHRVRGGDAGELKLYNLNRTPPYHFRIDAVNDGGVAAGDAIAAAP